VLPGVEIHRAVLNETIRCGSDVNSKPFLQPWDLRGHRTIPRSKNVPCSFHRERTPLKTGAAAAIDGVSWSPILKICRCYHISGTLAALLALLAKAALVILACFAPLSIGQVQTGLTAALVSLLRRRPWPRDDSLLRDEEEARNIRDPPSEPDHGRACHL
jgi:hypothetical protein